MLPCYLILTSTKKDEFLDQWKIHKLLLLEGFFVMIIPIFTSVNMILMSQSTLLFIVRPLPKYIIKIRWLESV